MPKATAYADISQMTANAPAPGLSSTNTANAIDSAPPKPSQNSPLFPFSAAPFAVE